MRTRRLAADAGGIARAAEILRDGGRVAFPTETVYGLGADARDGRAVASIYEAKGRPRFNPLIVHVVDGAAAEALARLDGAADRLASVFWPGPLTLVLPVLPGAGLSSLVTAGLPTVGIRVPELPVARDLLAAFGGPVAAPSANRSGAISPTTADHVLAGLDGRIEAVLDGGPCPVGLESTIIGFDPDPVLLRPGGLPAEVIEDCLQGPLAVRADPGGTVDAPGQLASHYAPAAPLRLDATERRAGEAWLGFGPGEFDLNLSERGDLVEAAATLFDHLHRLDARGAEAIAVAPVPDHGLGRAINDRLRRAAAPRDQA